MSETDETQEATPISPSPLEAPWFKDLKDGTGAAEDLSPDLREALALATGDRATDQVAAADEIPWRSDLLAGTGSAEGMSPDLQQALVEATKPTAIAQAGQDAAWQDELKAARDIANMISDKQPTDSYTPQIGNPRDPNS